MNKKSFLHILKNLLLQNKFEFCFVVILIIFSAFLRFSDLGYSHFYGDETKTLYLRKDISATDFLFNQRKGPVQFVATWSVEKLIGSYNEAPIRFPFALAGLISVVALYFIVRVMFNKPAAMFSSLLFSLNGFYIAFSRTAQYQSFLVLFGLLGLLFVVLSLQMPKYKKLFYVLSGIFYSLAVLSHYDALFFMIPGVYLLSYISKNAPKRSLLFFLVPFFAIVSLFYVPYVIYGYFANHTLSYIAGRIYHGEYKTNYTLYTYFVYNGVLFSILPFAFSIPVLFKFNNATPFKNEYLQSILFWFLVPAVLFLVVFLNPGTHIHNFFLPLIVISGAGFAYIYSKINTVLLLTYSTLIFTALVVTSTFFFVPSVNTGYPWKNSSLGPFRVAQIDNSYHLFLYGFPYYRGWNEIRAYFEENGMPRSYYTNDNVTISQYYLQGVPVHVLHPEKMPEYFIYIKDNQMFEDDFFYADQYSLEYSSAYFRIYKHRY